jgi:hypothetical protein
MTMCLSDETLLAVRLGEASPDDDRHAAACVLCAGRLASLRADLARIDAILASPRRAVVGRARAPIAIRLAPFVVAAAAALLLVVARSDAPAPAPARSDQTDVAGLVDEVSAAFEPVDDDGGDDNENDNDNGNDDDGDTDEASWAVSTCTLDEPFIGVGCDSGVQLTALTW